MLGLRRRAYLPSYPQKIVASNTIGHVYSLVAQFDCLGL
jgi:hypothetical protein